MSDTIRPNRHRKINPAYDAGLIDETMIRNRHKDIEIPEGEPFKYDKLERQQHAVNFMNMVSLYSETGCVIALNGLWGTGKTTFVKMMEQQMKNQRYKPLYFNAWTNDFVSDPLVAMLAEMKEVMPQSPKLEAVVKLGGKILTTIGGSIVKSVAKNKFGVDVDAVADDVADVIKDQIDEYTEQKKTLEDFKEALVEYVADNTEEGRPVVFFIDELDRCNPHFAVQVLERVKHLFDIPNMVFVLIINKKQLQHAICGYYGSENIDAENYLRRFVDVEYHLPEADKDKYFELLYNEYGFSKVLEKQSRKNHPQLRMEIDSFKTLMQKLIHYSDFDLRTIDKFMAHARLMMETYGEREYLFPSVVVLLVYLRFADYELYEQIKEAKLKPMDLVMRLDRSLAPMLQKIENGAVEYFRYNLMYPIARLIYVYSPDSYNEAFFEVLSKQHLVNINVDDLKQVIDDNRKQCTYGEKEVEYAINHVDLIDYIRNYADIDV